MKKHFVSIVFWANTIAFGMAQPTPIAEFRFDGTTENSGRTIRGIREYNVGYGPDRHGNPGKAGQFNGKDSKVVVPIDINPDAYPQLTIVLWAKCDYVDNRIRVLISHDDGGYDRSIQIDHRGGGWGWSTSTGNTNVLGYKKVQPDVWSFLAVTYDQATERVRFFADGTFYEKRGRLGPGLDYFHIGSNPTFGDYFPGALDDVRLYGQVLSDAQIRQLYEQESQGTAAPELAANQGQTYLTRQSPLADLVVRVGDIDNLGFGWPADFDPFSGKSTPVHHFPWTLDPNDYPGTDRIILGSKFTNRYYDGYSSAVRRDESNPEPVKLDFSGEAVAIRDATFQIFIDDFQAPRFGSSFQFRIDGKRIPYAEEILNSVNQSGPIGKLITFSLLPEDLSVLKDRVCTIEIDDPVTGIGDGFAIDFIQLLINRNAFEHTGTLSGRVTDSAGKPLAGVSVSAGNVVQTETDASGKYRLANVPSGLASMLAYKPGYEWHSQMVDLEDGKEVQIDIVLRTKQKETAQSMLSGLNKRGKVSLYGIHFDSGKSAPKSSSTEVLQELATLLKNNPGLNITIAGHTDSDGTDAYNLDLSDRRATAVRDWLVGKGIKPGRLATKGYGESAPAGDNATVQGKALNRRVDIELQ